MGGAIGGFLGYQASQNQINAANQARQQGLAQYNGISTPSVADQQLALQQYQNAGSYNPMLEQAQQLGPSAMTNVQVDPRLLQAQMSALSQLSQTGQMGMTPAESAALASAQQNAAAQAQAKSKQIQDQFARTGMGGSGAQLAAQLENAQGGAQMLANNSNQIAQNAQQNALQAIAQAGSLGGQMQGQQFGQQAAIAQAKDYINQFNLQNSQNVSNTNVGTQNQAALRNLLNQQSLMNQNTQLGNQQQQYNKQLLQQQFNNQMGLASGRAGQYQGIAQANQQQAGNTANMYASIGQGLDTGAGALYNAYNNSGQSSDPSYSSDMNYTPSGPGFSNAEQNAWLNSGSSPQAAGQAAADSRMYDQEVF